ncbi:hypothetical protein BD289DRAFT_172995 [Coniella lustricola]|uniref:PLD phosphodiesterase domain-containing protein n=1 Tax=Coniella lustricola TaxID=2025994 RepID=A0A2T2ZTV1_9PEZI|nr:hypothetical protein BD289DRAFT_172995 [Coniella lustricola]
MESFAVGTGASIFTQHLVPAILAAEHEVILVTCYWARSKMLTALCDALEQLAAQRHADVSSHVLRLRICFSSRSLFQKLFHTPSRDGYLYPPATWTTKLGLPSSDTLAAAKIELTVKSLFFLPFSVMHPKFLLVDRRHAFLPSCNISWEPWLEGCLQLSRRDPCDDPIDGLLAFYKGTWEPSLDVDAPLPPVMKHGSNQYRRTAIVRSPADTYVNLLDTVMPAAAVEWLPSWHHRNPRFCVLFWQTPKAPLTPLNSALLRLFENATKQVYLQTPNLTSPPVISAILQALSRGVDVCIVTNRKMMVWEQILTAGTTGDRCVRRLIKDYVQLCGKANGAQDPSTQNGARPETDLESQVQNPGRLKVLYFRPSHAAAVDEEPVHSHLKLSVFDGEHTVLGSGNMDRASWFTSQELGILVHGAAFAQAIKEAVDGALTDRLDLFFDSHS